MVIALRGHPLEANFQRILAWCAVSSALALAGGLAHGNTRILLWLGSVCVDLLGGIVGFANPGARPVPYLGLDHRGRSLRRALPGVHLDRAG
jgi:low temperature requirement protein LtrA